MIMMFEIHSMNHIMVDFKWCKGIAYVPSCMNCKHSSEPKINEWGDETVSCPIMCVNGLESSDICKNCVFEPKKKFIGDENCYVIR